MGTSSEGGATIRGETTPPHPELCVPLVTRVGQVMQGQREHLLHLEQCGCVWGGIKSIYIEVLTKPFVHNQ